MIPENAIVPGSISSSKSLPNELPEVKLSLETGSLGGLAINTGVPIIGSCSAGVVPVVSLGNPWIPGSGFVIPIILGVFTPGTGVFGTGLRDGFLGGMIML